MAPQGEIVITLTTDEVQALKAGLQELVARPGVANVKTIQAIESKLKFAEEKML